MPSTQRFSWEPLAGATSLLTEMLVALRAPGPVEAPAGAGNKIVTRQTIFVSRSGRSALHPKSRARRRGPELQGWSLKIAHCRGIGENGRLFRSAGWVEAAALVVVLPASVCVSGWQDRVLVKPAATVELVTGDITTGGAAAAVTGASARTRLAGALWLADDARADKRLAGECTGAGAIRQAGLAAASRRLGCRRVGAAARPRADGRRAGVPRGTGSRRRQRGSVPAVAVSR